MLPAPTRCRPTRLLLGTGTVWLPGAIPLFIFGAEIGVRRPLFPWAQVLVSMVVFASTGIAILVQDYLAAGPTMHLSADPYFPGLWQILLVTFIGSLWEPLASLISRVGAERLPLPEGDRGA